MRSSPSRRVTSTPDTRLAVTWFEQRGFAEGPFGEAECSRGRRTRASGDWSRRGSSSRGLGKVRLLRRDELPDDWDPVDDRRLTVWEATHHLMRATRGRRRGRGR